MYHERRDDSRIEGVKELLNCEMDPKIWTTP
jgi:hypothetical protein